MAAKMQYFRREISWTTANKWTLLLAAVALLAFCVLSETVVMVLSEAWARGFPGVEFVSIGLLGVAHLLGFASAREGKTSTKGALAKGKSAPDAAEIGHQQAGTAARAVASLQPQSPQGTGASAEVGGRADEIAKRLIELKSTGQREHDQSIITQAEEKGMAHMCSNVTLYTKLMAACYRLNRVDTALELYGHVIRHGFSGDVCAYSGSAYKFFKLVVENLTEARMRDEGVKLLDSMRAHGVAPTNVIQNKVICAWRSKPPEHVLEVYSKMRDEGVPLSSTAYRCIMSMHERARPERALELYQEMLQRGVKIDRVAFNVALCSFSNLGRFDEALQLFEGMSQHGLEPNAKTYGTMIRAYTVTGKAKEAADLFEVMRKDRIEPNRFAYQDAINCNVKLKRIGRAVQLYREMLRSGVTPFDGTYEHLSRACQRRGWTKIAEQITMDGSSAKKGEGLPASDASTEFQEAAAEAEAEAHSE